MHTIWPSLGTTVAIYRALRDTFYYLEADQPTEGTGVAHYPNSHTVQGVILLTFLTVFGNLIEA